MAFVLFDWIREGVRQSVLQGVEEALAAIGTPAEDPARQHLAALRQVATPADLSGPSPAGTTSGSPRRLGRRLRDTLDQPTERS
jgi:hypothetical protein